MVHPPTGLHRPLTHISPNIGRTWSLEQYPNTRHSDHVDVYKSEAKGEVAVLDPFEWLQHNTPETEKWVSEQEVFTRKYLDKYVDMPRLEEAIRKNLDYAKFSAPTLKKNGWWYWYYNSGLWAQSVIYRSKDKDLPLFSPDDEGPGGEVFFDGSDFYTIYIRRSSEPLASNGNAQVSHDDKRLPDEIRFVKFSSISWTHDSKGFFYQRYPDRDYHGSANDDIAGTETERDKNAMLCYHRLGTPQVDDIVVCTDRSQPDYFYGAEVTEADGKYAVMTIAKDTSRKNLVWIADLENGISEVMQWDKVIDDFDASYNYIANNGTVFYFLTNKDAPQYKLISVDISEPPEQRHPKEVIPEDKDAQLEDICVVNNDILAVVYKRNVKDEIYLYSMQGIRLSRLAEDFVGSMSLIGRREQSWFFVNMSSFTTPGLIARYDFKEADESKRWSNYRTTLVKGLNPEDFRSKQVWYTSKDGTQVPMFIVYHKNTKLDGTAPAIQYGGSMQLRQ
ncbi:hypothetical protein EIP86_010332 [Pleurotus ostreatoroseus]|nr:hypothetical protein EIP86_010332 [Pleurotus ostreatoroseus]